MTSQYQVINHTHGFTVYGPFCSVLKADENKVILYSNLNIDSDVYKTMVNALRNH